MKRLLTFVACSAMTCFLVGCAEKPAASPGTSSSTSEAPPAGGDEHAHPAHGAGPHGGAVTDWGGGAYHVEFTVDHDKKEVTVYIVGSDEKSPAPIKAESIHLVISEPMTEMDLMEKPLEGEAAGTSSRFVGTHDTIGIVREFSGTVSGQIDGTPYTGDFKEEPHADHK